MKKLSTVLLLLVLSVAFVLAGCGAGLEMPGFAAQVHGNGGTVVQKGEYLYFTNAYTPYSSLEQTVTNGAKNKEYGIFRVKLSSVNNKTIDYDENGFAKNVEQISPKLSGFESSGLYIVGDYLFFSSPNMHKTRNNENKFDYVTFFSIKLDGTGLRELYTTSSSANASWKIYAIEGKNYLINVEGDKIIKHTISGNKLTNKVVLAQEITSAILPNRVETEFDKNVYYTTNFSAQEQEEFGFSGNVLKSVNMLSGSQNTLYKQTGDSITLLSFQNSRLFYKLTSTIVSEGIYVLGQNSSALRISYTGNKTELFFMGEGKPLIYKANSKIMMQHLVQEGTNTANFDFEVLVDADAKVLFVSGDYVYYTQNDWLSRISVQTKQDQKIIEGTTENTNIDYDGRFIYVYKTLETGDSGVKYLHRVDTFSAETSRQAKFEVVGFVLEKDVEAKIEADKQNKQD